MNQQSTAGLILENAIATGAGEAKAGNSKRSFHAYGKTSAGTGAATILIEVSNIPTLPAVDADWMTLATITLTLGTTQTSDGFASDAPWRWTRARVTAISGTNAAVNVSMGSGQ